MENFGQQESIAPIAEAQIAQKALLQKQQNASASALPSISSAPTIDQASTEAIQSGANPLALAVAKQQLGEQEFIGFCESFVEKVEGSGIKYPSAIAAWNSNAQDGNAVSGTSGIKPGDAVYFNDPTQPYGHTGVYAGNNQFISATDNGVQSNDLGQWQQSTGQQLLGYIPGGKNGN